MDLVRISILVTWIWYGISVMQHGNEYMDLVWQICTGNMGMSTWGICTSNMGMSTWIWHRILVSTTLE